MHTWFFFITSFNYIIQNFQSIFFIYINGPLQKMCPTAKLLLLWFYQIQLYVWFSVLWLSGATVFFVGLSKSLYVVVNRMNWEKKEFPQVVIINIVIWMLNNDSWSLYMDNVVQVTDHYTKTVQYSVNTKQEFRGEILGCHPPYHFVTFSE